MEIINIPTNRYKPAEQIKHVVVSWLIVKGYSKTHVQTCPQSQSTTLRFQCKVELTLNVNSLTILMNLHKHVFSSKATLGFDSWHIYCTVPPHMPRLSCELSRFTT